MSKIILIFSVAATAVLAVQAEDLSSLRGVVLSSDGKPVNGATVVVQPVEGSAVRAAGTAEDGSFTISGLHAGGYVVWAAHEGFEVHRLEMELSPMKDTRPVTIRLRRVGRSQTRAVMKGDAERFDEATLMLQRGATDRALGVFERFIERFPFMIEAYYNAGLCNVDLASNAHRERAWREAEERERRALEHFSVALERYPSFAGALEAAASCHLRLRELAEAERMFARLLEVEPGEAGLWYTYGEVLVYRRNLPGAADAFRRALSLDAGFADAHAKLGSVLMTGGELREAAEHFETCLRLAPGSDMEPFARELLQECRELLRRSEKEMPQQKE